jgi:NAD(P)-dependent dehydrogenase (short-subunit alcohol dehydrogenase family)
METTQRAVVVTGASSGIGHACVQKLASSGFVVFAGVRKPSDGARLRSEGGDRVIPVEIDVTEEASIQSALESVRQQLNGRGLDGLVNNAGIGITAPVEYVALDVLRRQFDVNVFGQVAVTQAFLPLIRQARGRIVNMGSVGSHIAIPFGGALCATKSAFRSLNDALRLELHPFGIHVVMIEPASIRTPAVDKTLGDPDGTVRQLPPEGVARYGNMLRAFIKRGYEREQNGSPPEVVADAVYEALTAAHPRAHVPVGKHSTLLTEMPRWLPDALLDRVRYRLFGITQPPAETPAR